MFSCVGPSTNKPLSLVSVKDLKGFNLFRLGAGLHSSFYSENDDLTTGSELFLIIKELSRDDTHPEFESADRSIYVKNDIEHVFSGRRNTDS